MKYQPTGQRVNLLSGLPYEGNRSVLPLLEGLHDGHDWAPVEEAGKLIGLEKNGANVSLDPRGQLDLSGAPLCTIHDDMRRGERAF